MSSAQIRLFFIRKNSFESVRQALVAAKIAAVENGELDVVISTSTAFSCRNTILFLLAGWCGSKFIHKNPDKSAKFSGGIVKK